VSGSLDLSDQVKSLSGLFKLTLTSARTDDYTIVLSNELGEELKIGYDKENNNYFIDRSKAGKTSFESGFGVTHTAPRISKNPATNLTLLVDVASVELFADNGLNVMTDICFPNRAWSRLSIVSARGLVLDQVNISSLKSIW
jgi:fructan beta-fructosidase